MMTTKLYFNSYNAFKLLLNKVKKKICVLKYPKKQIISKRLMLTFIINKILTNYLRMK